MKKIYFATGNEGKVEEMRPRFEEIGLRLEQVQVDIAEIHATDVEEVAKHKVDDSLEKARDEGKVPDNCTLIVEDTGFYIEALDGFPGAEASFFASTAGVEKLLKLMEDEDNRKAYFKTALAVLRDGETEIFTGRFEGRIPEEKKGESHEHLPYNSYFVPDGESKSLAEDQDLKEGEFHRNKATDGFLNWLDKN